VASLAIFGAASGFKRQNDKVHWKGHTAKPVIKARDDVPLVEERTTSYRFLSKATKRKSSMGSMTIDCTNDPQRIKLLLYQTYHSISVRCMLDWYQLI
jgi:hypothetical protein